MSNRPRPYVTREILDGAGVYAIFPFDTLDEHNAGVFKIGMTTNFDKRLRGYHTYLPKGFYYKCFLKNPKTVRGHPGDARLFKKIEHEIFEDVKAHGGKAVYIDNRWHNDGETEWVYSKEKIIYDAFRRAYDKYGGDLEWTELSTTLRRKVNSLRKNAVFKGEIIF